MKYLMNVAYLFAAAAYSPVVLYRLLRHKRYKSGWGQRLGKIKRKNPDKKCIWIHAVSVGEVNATRTIVAELIKRFSDYEILITTTTDTGYARAESLYGDNFNVSYFPLDFSWIMSRAFTNIKPEICILMELEVWPNFAQIAHDSNIPVVVANGRISDRSFSRYKKIKPLVTAMFRRVDLILAQTKTYAERFKKLGCPAEKVLVTGSLKYDTAQITDRVKGSDELEKELNIKGEKLWVAGGTGNDEEKLIIDVYKNLIEQDKFKDLRLAIVPRKPERFDEVAELMKQAGFGVIRYSQIKTSDMVSPAARGRVTSIEQRATSDERRVILGDTMGDLRKFYSLATVIFVGRTLVPMGGSDMAEAAALGKCTIFGPHAFNFKQTVDVLLEGNGAVLVSDSYELQKVLQKCLDDENFRTEIAHNGQQVIRDNQGATAKAIEKISELLKASLH
ncbi:MAG: 3-deoxy-D-manno-octulosonic acid transferase [Sedimentisphaerales bacterium]|nr:3-deoxy-D-manno-octulosonic acid transferase [Sedimentisphaerales bacterium]